MGKKDGSDAANQARADEQARQARIRQGTERINSIFDGGTVGDGQLGKDAVFDPKATYYKADGSVWSPNGSQGSGNWSGVSTPIAGVGGESAFKSAVASGQLYSGTKQNPGFNDDFFKKREQAYSDYAMPQLDDQFNDAQKQLTFALARGGMLDSSTRSQQEGQLQKLYDTQKRGVADQALSYGTQARNSVEDARANLIATLNATGDAAGAANSALARSQALSQPAAFSPLGQLFSSFTSALGTQAALERAAAYSGGAVTPRYNTGLFGPGNAVKVT